MTLTPKLFLAVVCGFTAALLVAYGPSADYGAGWFLRYFMCGTLFAITVLWKCSLDAEI